MPVPEKLLLSTLEFYQQVGTLKSAQTEVLTHRKLANVDQQITAFSPTQPFPCTQRRTRNSQLCLVYFPDWCFKTDCRVQLRGETHHLGSSPPPTCVTLSTVGSLCFTVPVSRVKVVHAPSYKTSMGLNKSIHVKYPEQCWRIKGTPQTLAIILKLKYPLVLLFRLCR